MAFFALHHHPLIPSSSAASQCTPRRWCTIQGDKPLRRQSDLPIYISMCHKYSGAAFPPFGDLNCLSSDHGRGRGARPPPPFRPVKCSCPPSLPSILTPQPVKPREGAPPTWVPSFSTRAVISLKSTLLQVQEGGSPSVQAGSPSPPTLHQLGQLSPPRRSPPSPHSSRDAGVCPGPCSDSLVRVGTPRLRPPQSTGLFRTPGQLRKAEPLCPSSQSLWGLTLLWHILHLICMWFIKYKHA